MADAEPPTSRGSLLLIAHCAALDEEHCRPSARERLERIVGGPLARLLVGALGGHPRRSEAD